MLYKKQWIKGIAKLILFLTILFICIQIVHNITKRKESYVRMTDFLNQEEDFDVLFFGSSHVINGILPMELWENYGIVSYNLGNHGERMCTSYYNMLLALEQTNPKLVVIDTYQIIKSKKINEELSKELHDSLDVYPISYTKYLAIKDIFDNKNMLDNVFEYLFNFSIYHSRWSDLNRYDFEIEEHYEKGAELRINLAITREMSDFDSIAMYNKEETVNMQYLRKIIEHCKQNQIEVLVTYLPYPALDKEIAASKYAKVICDDYDVNYINFLSNNIVDYSVDFYDDDSHLNPSGARKVTEHIGEYIKENYDIPDQRENEVYNFWNKDYEEYIDYKIELLKENKNILENYLILLYGEKDIKYEINISSKMKIQENSTIYELLSNLENNYKVDDSAFESKQDKVVKITTWDNRTGKIISTEWW